MNIQDLKLQEKRQNIIKAIETKKFNRKIHKFNNFNEVDNKRNKAENRLYNLLDGENRKKFNFICEVLNLDLQFFNECEEKGYKLCNNKEYNKYGLVKCFNINSENFTTYKMSEIANLYINDEEDEFKGSDLMEEKPTKCENVFFKAIDENFNKLSNEEKIKIIVDKILNEGAEIEGNKLIEKYKIEEIKESPPPPPQTPKKPSGKKNIRDLL